MGLGSTNGEAPALPRAAALSHDELRPKVPACHHTSPRGGNVFACLVHEAPDCVADLVANLRHLDHESTVLLYDGSGGALLGKLSDLTGPGVLVHPDPRAMTWGKLHDFAVDCMRFAPERIDFGALTIVDSDQLALRPGYSAYLAAFLNRHPQAGCLVSAEGVQPRTTRIGPPHAAWREFELWAPFLQRFPDGESRFPHWTFWPATVFTRAAAQDLVALWTDEQLQDILARSAIWASEEVVLPTLVALLGHQVLRNPCAYDLVQYRVSYTAAQVEAAMSRPSVFWVHPVPRSYRDSLRSRLREHFGSYLPPAPAAPEPFAAPPAQPLPLLLPLLSRMEMVEGWLSAAEADLLAAAAVRAMAGRPGPHTVVEVGSYCGRGTVVLGGVAATLSPGSVVHAVDPHDRRLGVWGAPPGGVPDAAGRLRFHLDAAGLADTVDYCPGYAGEVAVPGPIDLLVIDHLHDYASVAADFSQLQGQLVEEGLVAFHDYRDCFPGVVAFVDQLLATGSYTAVQRVETLVVLRKTGVLLLPPLSPVLAGAGSAGERDALALLALTAAEALHGGDGSIVDAGSPTPAEDQLLAAVAKAAGREHANRPPAELLVGLLLLGDGNLNGGDIDAAFGYRERLADSARVVLRGYSDHSPASVAALRTLLAGGFEQVQRMAGLVVLRAGADLGQLDTAPHPELAVGDSVPARASVAAAPGRISAQPTGSGRTGEPLVSCIMPTCDRRRFVGRAIRYFLDQDYPNRELVVVDDGADCVGDLIPDDPRIRYVRLVERRTIGAKRNLACEQARGELIVHWDDDDWSAPRRLRYQVEMFRSQDVDVSGLSALFFCDPAAGRAWRYEYPAGRRPWVHDPTFCYRRRFWEGTPFPDTSFGIDASYLWQGPAKRVGVLPDSSFYVALVHPGNTSRKNVHDAWWHPRPVEEIASLMGPEWAVHWAPESVS